MLKDQVPQGHKVALVDLNAGDAVLRYGVRIGRALRDIEAGRWVHERLLEMPEARGLAFADGSVGTRNLLAITTTVQCVAGVVDHAVDRIRANCCRCIRMPTTWSASSTAAAWRSMRRTR